MSSEKTPGSVFISAEFAQRLLLVKGKDSLVKFANDLDVNYQDIQKYLAGSEPRAAFLMRLRERKKISLGWLLFGTGSMVIPDENLAAQSIAEEEASYKGRSEKSPLTEFLALLSHGEFTVTITITPKKSPPT